MGARHQRGGEGADPRRAHTGRRLCAHGPAARSAIGACFVLTLSLALLLPLPALSHRALAGEAGPEEGAPESPPSALTLDTTQPMGASLQASPQLASLLLRLGQDGLWLLPASCSARPADAPDPMDEARDALFDQRAEGVEAAAMAGLMALACGEGLAAPRDVAQAWFYLGVARLMEEDAPGVARYFSAIQALDAPGFVPPELGQRVRDAFNAAAGEAASGAAERIPGPPASAAGDPGADLSLDGVPLPPEGAALAPVPHLLQMGTRAGRPFGVLLTPAEGGWRLGEGDAVPAAALPQAFSARFMEDVTRDLRVLATTAGAPSGGAEETLAQALAEEGVSLTLLWRRGGGELQRRTFEPATAAASAPDAGLAAQEGTSRRAAPQAPHRVSVSLGAGASLVRGVMFTPTLAGDLAIETPLPFRVELGLGGAMDVGQQGEALRGILSTRGGLRFTLREDLGLFATLGLMALTRGPDPADPSLFIIEGLGAAWLRVRPPGAFPIQGPYLELGGGVAPGIWRSGGALPEGVGTAAWLHLGYERR